VHLRTEDGEWRGSVPDKRSQFVALRNCSGGGDRQGNRAGTLAWMDLVTDAFSLTITPKQVATPGRVGAVRCGGPTRRTSNSASSARRTWVASAAGPCDLPSHRVRIGSVTNYRLFLFVGGLALRGSVPAGNAQAHELGGVRWGREVPEVVRTTLRAHGWNDFQFPEPAWLATTGDWGKASLLVIDYAGSESADLAHTLVLSRAIRFMDLLTLMKGGTPRIVGSVFATRHPHRDWQAISLSTPAAARTGSDLLALLPDSAPVQLSGAAHALPAVINDARLGLWLRLFRAACQTEGWDARIFQLFVLLDVIGREYIRPRVDVLDDKQRPLRNDNGKRATTSQPRGRLYQLVRDALAECQVPESTLLAHPDHNLWHEAGIWLDIRDAVAHEGAWTTTPSRKGDGWQRVRSAAASTARGGTLDEGVQRYERALGAAAETVLYAVIARSQRRT